MSTELNHSRPRGLSPNGHRRAAAEHGPVEETIEQIVRIEQRDRMTVTLSDRIADRITAFSGSMLFFYVNALWFAIWIPLNLGWLGVEPFDPFPFGLLTKIVSRETIFVLISQNRQAMLADRRAKVDLQVDMLAEQEVTKLMNLVPQIHHHLGLSHPDDPEISAMRRRTDIEHVLDKIDEAEQKLAPESAKGPDGAADTEA